MAVATGTRETTALTRADLARVSGPELRRLVREGRWTGTTKRLAFGREQANLVILPERYAFDFVRFCLRNPKPLPLLEVTDPGDPEPKVSAPGADIRTDVPAYHLYRDGELIEELPDIRGLWRDDSVAFLTGCSLSLDQVMLEAGIRLPHLVGEEARTAQYLSTIACVPAGIFAGPQVVTLRPVPREQLMRFVELTTRFPRNHGAPLHIGDPAAIGIADLEEVAYGKPSPLPPDHVPVFFACGITAQAIARAARIPEMITHAPGHMFVTDLSVVAPTT